MTADEYLAARLVEVELDGVKYQWKYRVISGSVVVYYKDGVKYGLHENIQADVVARWFLSDMCRKPVEKKPEAICP